MSAAPVEVRFSAGENPSLRASGERCGKLILCIRYNQAFSHRCAGRPAGGKGCESLTMKVERTTSAPSSCASDREVWGEALTGEAMGQVLSHVTKTGPGCRRFLCSGRQQQGNTVGRAIASALPVPRGRRPWHVADTSCTGTGRSHAWPGRVGRGPHWEGRRAEASDARA